MRLCVLFPRVDDKKEKKFQLKPIFRFISFGWLQYPYEIWRIQDTINNRKSQTVVIIIVLGYEYMISLPGATK